MAQVPPKDPFHRRRMAEVLFIVSMLLVALFVGALWAEGMFDKLDKMDGDYFKAAGKKTLIVTWRLALAILLGLVVGMEREHHAKPAGIRTITMVCVGSCFLVLISEMAFAGEDAKSRIMQGIITGIGFLGAGTIIKHEFNVEGLTTAATVWAAAGVGLACGLGHYVFAGLGTLAIWTVLKVFQKPGNHPRADGDASPDSSADAE